MVLEKGLLSFALGSVVLASLFYAGIGIKYEGGRVSIFGDNENIIGLRMSISMAILILTTAENRLKLEKTRYLFLLPIPIMLQLMAETGSRVAFISFTLVFVMGIILFKTKRLWGKISIFSVGSIALIYSWVYMLQSETLVQRLLKSYEEGDLAGRDLIWRGLYPLIEDNPILGVGNTGYEYFTKINFGGRISPHNVILEVLSVTGIIGLIIYLLFLFRVFKKGYQNYKTEGLLLPLLLIAPILGMIFSAQILYVKIGWAIFAYIVGSSVCKPKQETIDKITPLTTYENSLRHR